MRILVVGTSGQLATELRRAATASLPLLPAEKVDLAVPGECEALLSRTQPQLVINAAAYTAVDRAETEPDKALAVNAQGPELLARWCERHGAALIHVSTDYVFDGASKEPYHPRDATNPLNVYGATKLAGEQAIRAALERHVILRTSWVFSAHGNNFVKTMMRLGRERDELRVVADQRGRPTFAGDLAAAVLHVAARWRDGASVAWGTHHFASEGATTWFDLARSTMAEQARYTGRAPRVTPIATSDYPTPARRPQNSVLDTSSFEEAFELAPPPWSDGLRAVVTELSTA